MAKMVTPVKLGAGGPIGAGTQFMPWISLTDLTRLLIRLAKDRAAAGVVNGVGPAPVRQHEFMRVLGKVLHRPAVFPMPAFMVKILFGQMGVELLLTSLRVIPTKLPEWALCLSMRRWRRRSGRNWIFHNDKLPMMFSHHSDANSAGEEAAVDDDGVAVGIAGGGGHEIDGGTDQFFSFAETGLWACGP